MNKILLPGLLALAAAGPCPAQAPQIPFALPPRAPERAEWIVTFGEGTKSSGPDQTAGAAKADGDSGADRTLVSRHVTKDGGTKKIIESYANGAKTESWLVGPLFIFQVPETKDIYLRDTSAGSTAWLPAMARGADFPELSWIGPGQLKGEAKVGERDCLVFESTSEVAAAGKGRDAANTMLVLGGGGGEAGAPRTETIVRRAWIDKGTGLPVRASEGPAVYRFAQDPRSPGTVPDAYKALEIDLIQRKKSKEKHNMSLR
jgi:hypothetical protein